MDRAKAKAIREALEHCDFSDLEKSLGVKVSIKGGGSYDDLGATFKLQFLEVAEDGAVVSPEERDYKRLAASYGLDPEKIGCVFVMRGERFKISGLNTRRHKFPVSAIRVSDGKNFKFPVNAIKTSVFE